MSDNVDERNCDKLGELLDKKANKTKSMTESKFVL